NAGRWDYIFSVIKNFRARGSDYLLPDRSDVTMTVPFMRAYTELLVHTCHKRGAHAIGGMSAFVPSKDPDENEAAFDKVREDKSREASKGFDGSWVAHPGMVALCKEVFTETLVETANQIEHPREDVSGSAVELLDVKSTPGSMTEKGLRTNVSVGIQYLRAWLEGNGAVAINGLMEDAATAEISRSQVWQWMDAGVELDTGVTVTADLVRQVVAEEVAKLPGEESDWKDATDTFLSVAVAEDYVDFLTLPAYARMP
ncbi:MAG: malate synthase A, partial [Brevibacterium sp.]|nr:malate synthase A [Brevibacterium sp.]